MKNILLIFGLSFSVIIKGQTPQIDSTADDIEYDSAIETDEAVYMEDTYDYPIEAVVEEATEETSYQFKTNPFKQNQKIKLELKPDKRAYYSLGNTDLFKNIYENLSVPYAYSQSTKSELLILKFIVGKDSQLYNPEVLQSPGASYAYNAQEVIEQLPGKFIPATKSGKPVDSILYVPIRFDNLLYNNRYLYPEPSETSDY